MKITKEQQSWHTPPTTTRTELRRAQTFPTRKGHRALAELATTDPGQPHPRLKTDPNLAKTLNQGTPLHVAVQHHAKTYGTLTAAFLQAAANHIPTRTAVKAAHQATSNFHTSQKAAQTHLIYTWAFTLIAALTTFTTSNPTAPKILTTTTITTLLITLALTTLATLETHINLPNIHLTATSYRRQRNNYITQLKTALQHHNTPGPAITKILTQLHTPKPTPTRNHPTILTHHLPTAAATLTVALALLTALN